MIRELYSYIVKYLVAPTSALIQHNNNLTSYCNQTITFSVEFDEAFPQWESIFWTMDGQKLSDARFLINTDVTLLTIINRLTLLVFTLIQYIVYLEYYK